MAPPPLKINLLTANGWDWIRLDFALLFLSVSFFSPCAGNAETFFFLFFFWPPSVAFIFLFFFDLDFSTGFDRGGLATACMHACMRFATVCFCCWPRSWMDDGKGIFPSPKGAV